MNNKKNKRTKSSSSKNLSALKRGIITLFKGSDRPLTHKDICRLLQVKDKITKHQILFVIKNLLADRTIRFALPVAWYLGSSTAAARLF